MLLETNSTKNNLKNLLHEYDFTIFCRNKQNPNQQKAYDKKQKGMPQRHTLLSILFLNSLL
ncbi:hypothetical protein HQ50_04905 [Porphyromonas sp. COT-052 OH4946]|nr:hypothetical protein HQ50_04905 [Porphyromonas sp. COT-052 OH4946]